MGDEEPAVFHAETKGVFRRNTRVVRFHPAPSEPKARLFDGEVFKDGGAFHRVNKIAGDSVADRNLKRVRGVTNGLYY